MSEIHQFYTIDCTNVGGIGREQNVARFTVKINGTASLENGRRVAVYRYAGREAWIEDVRPMVSMVRPFISPRSTNAFLASKSLNTMWHGGHITGSVYSITLH